MYTINKTLLQVLRTKNGYDRLEYSIKPELFDKDVRKVLREIRSYWEEYPETNTINMEVFASNFHIKNKLTDQERNIYNDIFLIMQDEADPITAKELIKSLKTMHFSKEIENAVTSYAIGDDIDLFDTIQNLVHFFETDIKKTVQDEWCSVSLENIILDETKGSLLTPKLECLAKSMPGLRTGMQVIVAARPGKGKTSFCADLITGFKNTYNRPILWLNNEGKALRIKGACMRSGLKKDFDAISKIGYKVAEEKFFELMGGPDMLRIYDIHGRDYKHIERIIEQSNPICVIWDMLDNVRGFAKESTRTDQRLEQLYQWSRECAVKYDFLSVPTSQISASGADMQWVSDEHLKDSKTGKQGACDAIITIGTCNKEGFEKSRFIFIPKTKFQPVDGFPSDCRTEVYFDGNTSSFYETKPRIGGSK